MPVTGFLSHTWAIVAIVIGLLSGALSVLREFQVMYFPPKAESKRVFWGWVRIAFVAAAILLWLDEHSKVKQLYAASGPSIQITTPPAVINSPPQTAYMKGHDPAIVLGSYKLGGNWAVSVQCENTSPTVIAQDAICQDGLRVVKTVRNTFKEPIVDKSAEDAAYLDFRKILDAAAPHRRNYGPGENGLSTVYSQTIDVGLDEAFRKGAKTILFLADFSWKDGAGEHHNEVCSWLQMNPQMFSGPGALAPNNQFVFHYCVEHNGVRK